MIGLEIMLDFPYIKDFYSHSNWVELGKTTPYSALIRPDQPLQNLAGKSLPATLITVRNTFVSTCFN